MQTQLQKIEQFFIKIKDNMEVTFDDEEIERQNEELLEKVCDDTRVQSTFRALVLF